MTNGDCHGIVNVLIDVWKLNYDMGKCYINRGDDVRFSLAQPYMLDTYSNDRMTFMKVET